MGLRIIWISGIWYLYSNAWDTLQNGCTCDSLVLVSVCDLRLHAELLHCLWIAVTTEQMCIIMNWEYTVSQGGAGHWCTTVVFSQCFFVHYSEMLRTTKTEKKGVKLQKMNGRWKEISAGSTNSEREITGTEKQSEHVQLYSCLFTLRLILWIQHDLYKPDIFMNAGRGEVGE